MAVSIKLPLLSADAVVRRDARVFAEQVKSLYQLLPTSMAGSTIAGVVLVLLMWGNAPTLWLLGWLLALGVNQLWRTELLARFKRVPTDAYTPDNMSRWCHLWMLSTGISGLMLGIAGFAFFDPDSALRQLLLVLILFVMCSGSVPLLATHSPALYVFIPPVLLPLAARMLMSSDETQFFIAIVLIIAAAFMLFIGRHYGRVLIDSLNIRFENVDLIRELSAQKKSADEARSEAEIANRSKTQFFAAASHDLRQPLHAMGLFAAALSEKVRDPGVIDVVHSINASVEALEMLFNELLDISKIDAGVIKPNPVHFSLQGLFDRLRMDLEPEAAEKELTLRFVPTARYVYSDPILVERIVRNLVANAIRYTQKGGVLVGCRLRGGRVWVEVWDSGIGIAANQQEKVFEEFYQIGNPERDRRKGLGLGLSIVQRLTALLGADLQLASRPGRGTLFRFALPLGSIPRAPMQPAKPAPGSAADLSGFTIMVIDDEPSILEGMKVLLGGWGAQVLAAGSAAEALRELNRPGLPAVPDLLIVDYRLRESETGLEVMQKLRAHFGCDVPGILVTGSTSIDLAEAAKSQGLHLLTKPVMPAKLRTLINFKLREGVPK